MDELYSTKALRDARAKGLKQPGITVKRMVKDGKLEYDYLHQAWVHEGTYLPCNHTCLCYGTQHAGEPVDPEARRQKMVK